MKPRRRCRTWLIRAERIGAQSVAGVGEGTGARSAADVAVLAGGAFSLELEPAAADCGVDFYGSWQDSWRPIERDACGRSGKFLANAFPYDSDRDCFICPAGKILTRRTRFSRGHGVYTRVYHAGKTVCAPCPFRSLCAPANAQPGGEERLRISKSPRPQPHSKPRRRPKRHNRSKPNAARSPSFRKAWIKERCGLQQFRCRGRWQVSMEATWACLSYNHRTS